MKEIRIFTDGGARGNPGPAALGVYIEDEEGNKLATIGQKLGDTTNNVAEYSAILAALTWLNSNKKIFKDETKITLSLDSQLAYSQILGLYKVKHERMRELLFKVREKEAELGRNIKYLLIPRELNKRADELVNLALDNKI